MHTSNCAHADFFKLWHTVHSNNPEGHTTDILILDDSIEGKQILGCLSSHNLRFAETIHSALETLKTTPCQLVICAIHLQHESAFNFLHQVKSAYPNLPFICFRTGISSLTPSLDDGLRYTAVMLGAVRYISSDDFPDAGSLREAIEACFQPLDEDKATKRKPAK